MQGSNIWKLRECKPQPISARMAVEILFLSLAWLLMALKKIEAYSLNSRPNIFYASVL
jgi:hypothetical protein